MSILVKQAELKQKLNIVRDMIVFNDNITDKTKYRLLDLMNKTEFVVDESLITNSNKHIVIVKEPNEQNILHELYHILLSHTTKINRNKIHNPCVVENLIFDIQVEELLSKHYNFQCNINNLKNKLFSIYNDSIEPTVDNILSIDCSKCSYNISTESCHDMKAFVMKECISKQLRVKLLEVLQQMTKRQYVATKHRNYIKSKYFLPTKRELLTEIYIVVDTSTSIPREVVQTIISTCKEIQSRLTYVYLYGFSDIVYKLDLDKIRHVNKTNFTNVYNKFKNRENVILISDLEFSDEELCLLDRTNFTVINVKTLVSK